MYDIFSLMVRYTSTIFPVKKVVNLTAEQAKRIRDYRFAHQIDSENEAIRQLIEAGLGKAPSSEPSGGGGSEGGENPPPSSKSAAPPARKEPAPKTAPTSKLEQIRALREQGAS
jgi:hypothetical protein